MIQFLADWRQEQHGAIERSGRLKIDYDKGRLPRCFAMWRGAEFGDIVASIRFHPRGEVVSGSAQSDVPELSHRVSRKAGRRHVPD